MNLNANILKIVNYVGVTLSTIGLIIFTFGFFGNGNNILTPIGIGTIMGAVFIFVMGIFFVATEEMLNKTKKGASI
ncbi:hypothetical protein ACFFHH_23555 [Cytobacillus solani]|uniref:Uncharacterized protein n=1 Tax=Cytobacillus solani TaxID=1637975 RepID=A0A0Q3QPS2_9BACI|nr:hypothetical protein [Cytobacillus solani]KOP82596.1 hypothetical protein AMS60_08975 [Bacillus sp. FJAT-21945]KQL19608.1 hypothetical protein AN957_14245 [Cytobacillus solani]USK52838.1 hypothetical protein LIS82_14470 [Cytobacillus solani]